MSQRKCGTCRYFEEGGIASSGWCRHPERQDLQHTVLVRKTELACRTGRGHVLWEPKGETSSPRPVINEDVELVGARSGPTATLFRTSGTATTSAPSIAPRPRHRFLDDDADEFLQPAVTHGHDSRQTTAMESGTAPARGNHRSAPGAESADGRDRDDRFKERDLSVTWGARFKQMSGDSLDDLDFETFESGQQRAQGLSRNEDWRDSNARPGSHADSDHSRGAAPLRRVRESHRESDESDAARSARDNRARIQHTSDSAQRFGAFAVELASDRRSQPVVQSGMTEPIAFVPTDEPEEEALPDVVSGRGEEPEMRRRQAPPLESHSEEIDREPEGAVVVHPSIDELPRCCRTCRDFRPIDGGVRGMCNNAYAVTKDQMVNPEDLPCDGTFGNWWTPTDDWWRARADISHHYAPTPLVDELVRELRARLSPEGSTDRRSTT